jgi:hypothetical protein
MTEFILKKLKTGFDQPEFTWSGMLNPTAKPKAKVKTAPVKKAVKKTTKAKGASGK